MIGLDTNVLVRLLTRDDARQAKRARDYLAAHVSADAPAFVSREVLLETVWVLESAYRYDRADIANAVEGTLETAELHVEAASCARSAARAYRSGTDFNDALVAAANENAGCETTLTLDTSAAARIGHFTLL